MLARITDQLPADAAAQADQPPVADDFQDSSSVSSDIVSRVGFSLASNHTDCRASLEYVTEKAHNHTAR
jgi:hypothetical protein